MHSCKSLGEALEEQHRVATQKRCGRAKMSYQLHDSSIMQPSLPSPGVRGSPTALPPQPLSQHKSHAGTSSSINTISQGE